MITVAENPIMFEKEILDELKKYETKNSLICKATNVT